MKIITDNNYILDATVSIEKNDLVFHSRGGAKNSDQTRNLHYSIGVETIIERLKKMKIDIINIYINSSKSIRVWPELKDRQLSIDNEYDISLSKYEAKELRIKIGNELSNKKENIDSKGGNTTKKFLLTVPNKNLDWESIIRPHKNKIIDDIEVSNDNELFNPLNIEDAIEKIKVSITKREGQTKFRKQLLEKYDNKCAITQSNVIQVLQAAHIIPYKGKSTNHITNGIILRSDIHDLFDLNLLSIDENYKVIVSPLLKESEYENYHGNEIYMPKEPENRPSIEGLKTRPKLYRD